MQLCKWEWFHYFLTEQISKDLLWPLELVNSFTKITWEMNFRTCLWEDHFQYINKRGNSYFSWGQDRCLGWRFWLHESRKGIETSFAFISQVWIVNVMWSTASRTFCLYVFSMLGCTFTCKLTQSLSLWRCFCHAIYSSNRERSWGIYYVPSNVLHADRKEQNKKMTFRLKELTSSLFLKITDKIDHRQRLRYQAES